MFYIKLVIAFCAFAALGYWRRFGIRQAWYVLRTEDGDPDFELINASYFLGREKGQRPRESLAEKIWARWKAYRSS